MMFLPPKRMTTCFLIALCSATGHADPFLPTEAVSTEQPLFLFDSLSVAYDYPDGLPESADIFGVEVRAYTEPVPQFTLNDHSLTLVISVNENVASGILHSKAFRISPDEFLVRRIKGLTASLENEQIVIVSEAVDLSNRPLPLQCTKIGYQAIRKESQPGDVRYEIEISAPHTKACH